MASHILVMWGAAGSFWGSAYLHTSLLPPPYCLLLTQRHIQMSSLYKKIIVEETRVLLHTFIPTYLQSCIPTYPHTCIPKYLHTLESSGAGLLISWWTGGRLASSGAGLLICWWSGGRLPSSGARARLLISGWSGGRLASSEARLLISW